MKHVSTLGQCKKNENERVRKVNAEKKVEKEIAEGKARAEQQERIEREPGRVIFREEYRHSAKDRSCQSDTVWNDKSFTAVEEIRNWESLVDSLRKCGGKK